MNKDQRKIWREIERVKRCLRDGRGYGTGQELHGGPRQQRYEELHRTLKRLAKELVECDERYQE